MADEPAKQAPWLYRKEKKLINRGSLYRAYSWLFVPCALVTLIALPLSGRELIWNVDGLGQYYPFFIYEGRWLRGIVGSLFGGEGLQIPLWEWCSGYGVDVPTTFDVFLDPLNLVSAIVPEALSEWAFQLLVVVRLYLAGLAFVYYCHTRGENKTGTVVGALLYALCGSGLTAVRWSSGLHALILFPVVLAGAERIFAGKKPWVFVASLSLLTIVSYYFTYMACILLVGYLAIRVVMIERSRLSVRRFLTWVAIFFGLIALCFTLAAFVLVPTAASLMGMDRLVNQTTDVPLLYQLTDYLALITSYLSSFEVGSDTILGFGALPFLTLILFFSQKDYKELKLVFIGLTIFLCLPAIGSFLNAMNYASNRWAWGYDLCVSLILVRMTPRLLSLDQRAKRILMVGVVAYAIVLVVPFSRTEANVAGYAALLFVFILLLMQSGTKPRATLVLALGISLAVNGFYFLSSDEGGRGTMQTPLGMAYTKLTKNSSAAPILDVEQSGWWRYDKGRLVDAVVDPIPNNSLVLNRQGIDFYNSVYNDRIDAFHTELGIVGDDINFRYESLQGRSDLLALLGARYYVYRNDGTDCLPYGFSPEGIVSQRDIMGINYQVIEANMSLPMGIAFDKALSRESYLSLTPSRRQQALLQAVVLEDAESNRAAASGAPLVDPSSLTFDDASVPFEVASATGVELQGNRFVVAGAGSSITLAFEGANNADTYLYVAGLNFETALPSSFISEADKASMLWHYRANLLMQDLTYEKPTSYIVYAKSDAAPLTGILTNSLPSSHMYGGKDTWLLNLGYAQSAPHTITITFSEQGIYTFDDLQILTRTYDHFDQWLQSRQQTVLEDVAFGCNCLTGTIDLDREQTLLLTAAYSPGWTAYVDGNQAALHPADTGFMALDVTAGHHTIELRYQTPGLAVGFAISGAGLIALVALALVLRHRDGTQTRNEDKG